MVSCIPTPARASFSRLVKDGQRVGRLVGYGGGEHGGGHGVVADDPDHLFHQVLFDVYVVAPVGDAGFQGPRGGPAGIGSPMNSSTRSTCSTSMSMPRTCFNPRRGHRHRPAARRWAWEHVDDALGDLPAGDLPHQLGGAAQGDGGQAPYPVPFRNAATPRCGRAVPRRSAGCSGCQRWPTPAAPRWCRG